MEARHASPPAPTTDCAYTLRTLIANVPLAADAREDEDEDDNNNNHVWITSVDTWEGNLYIGTSAAELLHFVSIPTDEPSAEPTWILASRLQPPFSSEQDGPDKGVKQILLLPSAGKACVLCNSTLTFYTLPELSPAFGGKIKQGQAGCIWVGGLDLSESAESSGGAGGPIIVLCLRQRLRLIRIGDEARKIRDIELGGVGAIQRRGDLACVADGSNYSLLDVVNQRKNELFPICSTAEAPPPRGSQVLAPPQPDKQAARRSFSTTSPVRKGRGHERIVSLGAAPKGEDRLRPDGSSPWPSRTSSQRLASPSQSSSRDVSPAKSETGRATPPPPSPKDLQQVLPPHIVSPTPTEFLLTTGTKRKDPSVGMFVNLDGDVVRGTIEFSTYPDAVLLDGGESSQSTSPQADDAHEGYVLALVRRKSGRSSHPVIEIQRWDSEPGEAHRTRQYLAVPDGAAPDSEDGPLLGTGLRTATSTTQMSVPEISQALRLRRLRLADDGPEDVGDAEEKRNREEDALASRFSTVSTRVLLFTRSQILWAVRSNTVTRLNAELDLAVTSPESGKTSIDPAEVQPVLDSIRGREASSELEFLTLTYIRQKASLLLFGVLLLQTAAGFTAYERDKRAAIQALEEGDLDPRILLMLVPPLAREVREGQSGIWVPQGLVGTVALLRAAIGDQLETSQDAKGPYGDNLLQVLKRYLLVWSKKKGFGSVADEAQVFFSVDAALLHVLLLLDQQNPPGPATGGSVRAELNEVVDKGVDCFDRAVELFEQFHRLYMLSRLYQSRKAVSQVLQCWRRILDGERDAGGELVDGEADLRRYLAKIRDRELVTEYGTWLAKRNAKLGVQVFADESARVKFTPAEAVDLLKQKAPGAVKDYLEHLVFGRNHVQYVDDLLSFYLSTVLSELSRPDGEAEAQLLQSYETYRALRPPKSTYRDFIADNAVPAEWWANRLRLLQLIGGSHGAAGRYDAAALRARLEPHRAALVPEMIILHGRDGRHREAIHLLVAALGDYDTAVRYCLLGGSSIFHSPAATTSTSSSSSSSSSQQQPALPDKAEQATLFSHLLHELLALDDEGERLARAAELLDRFGAWFDAAQVLDLVPGDWAVGVVAGFLVAAVRRLVRERRETGVVRALAGAQNLKASVAVLDKIEGMGPVVVEDGSGVGGADGGE